MNETTTAPSPVTEPKRKGRPPTKKPLAPLKAALESTLDKMEKIIEATKQEGMERVLADGDSLPKIDAAYESIPPANDSERLAKHFTKEELEGAFSSRAEIPIPETAPPIAEVSPPPPVPPAEVIAPPTPPPTQPGLLYVKKVQAAMPFFVNKERLNFEMLGNNVGVGIFNEETQADKCAAIRKAFKDRRGGIVVIDEATYQGLKKKLGAATPRRSSSPLKVFQPNDHLPKLKNLPAASAAAVKGLVPPTANAGTPATGAVGGSPAPVKFAPKTRRFGPRPIAPPPPLARPID